MADEVLRLRATVVSDEALANIRAIGREIGLVPRNAGRGVATLNTQFASLGKTIAGVGREITGVVPALGGFGLGAAGIGVAAGLLIRTLGDTAKKIVELKYASKELGMSEQSLRGWSSAAEKAGIAPEAMLAGLKNFKRNTEDFSNRIGELRGQMVAMGAGPVLARINAATNQLDKLKAAYDFKETLDEADPSGMKSRRFFEMIGLGADAARLSYAQFIAEKARHPILTDAEKKAAQDYADNLVNLGTKWDGLKIKLGVKLFPTLTTELDKATSDFERFFAELDKPWFGFTFKWDPEIAFKSWKDSWTTFTGLVNNFRSDEEKKRVADFQAAEGAAKEKLRQEFRARGELAPDETPLGRVGEALGITAPYGSPAGAATPAAPETPAGPASLTAVARRRARWRGGKGRWPGAGPSMEETGQLLEQASPDGEPITVAPRTTFKGVGPQSSLNSNIKPVAYGDGFQPASFGGGSDESGASRIIQVGVFDALVQFKSYVETGAAGGGDGGIVRASFGGSAGAASTGQGMTGGPQGGDLTGAGSMGIGAPGGGQGAPRPGPGGQGGGGVSPGTGGGDGGPERTQGGAPAQLNDQGGKPIDRQTMKQAEELGRAGDTAGLQKLFAQKGYRMSGPACGMVASAYVKSAGFKPPPGGAMASNWNDWAEKTDVAGINKEGRPFGSVVASYKERRYGGNEGAPLRKGEKGGHVMTVVPGTYDAKTNTAMFADQYGVRRRAVKNMDLRYAGDEAVAAAARARGEEVAAAKPGGAQAPGGSPDGSSIPRPEGGGQVGSGGGQEFLYRQREKFKKEMENNPELKKRVAALGTLENEGDPAVLESLYNRADYTGRSIEKSIGGGKKSFYGPERKGLVEGRIRELERDPERMKRAMETVDRALSTNLTRGNTDQGSGSDPNIIAGGTGVNRKGGREVAPGTPGAERYNVFGGGPGGHRGAAAYRDRQQAAVRRAEERGPNAPLPYADAPGGLRSGGGYKVLEQSTTRIDQAVSPPAPTGQVNVNVHSNGTKADAQTKTEGKLFQEPTVRQHRQMQRTEDGGESLSV